MEPIEICTVEWAPYTSKLETGHGIALEYLTAVLNNMGYAPEYLFMSTSACEKQVVENEQNEGIRGAFPFYTSDDRKNKGLLFSDPLFEVEEVVFYNKSENPGFVNIHNDRELTGHVVAFVKGYAHAKKIVDVLDSDTNSIEIAPNEIDAFRRLTRGKVDMVPAAYIVGMQILESYFPDYRYDIDLLKYPIAGQGLHFMVCDRNPHNQEFIVKFNASLKQIDKFGVFKQRLKTLRKQDRQVVRLEDANHTFVVGRDRDDPDRGYLLPQGTRAEIIKWSESILNARDWPPEPTADGCTEVLVINGPHIGRKLCIDNQFIILVSE